jgi:HD superfamily phosphohydrolase
MAMMRWDDRVYGEVKVEDPGVLALIDCPTFRRLQGIKQAGPSALAFPFKTVTRFEHSLGVYILLGKLGADRREQIAGLLHDISHTAFSHAVDFVFDSEEQDHHEGLKPEFLNRPDLVEALASAGHRPEEFLDDSAFPLLERPIPELCADRLDYFFRDSLACSVTTPEQVTRFLAHLTVIGTTIAFNDAEVAREAAERFSVMNREWWASPTEAYIYNEFADAIKEAFRTGVLRKADLLGDDAQVLGKLRAARGGRIGPKLQNVIRFRPEAVVGYAAKVSPKNRWIDPAILDGMNLRKLSGKA